MEQVPKQENMLPAHWKYTEEEWNAFLRYKKRMNGFMASLFYSLFSGFKRKVPMVKITPEMISIGTVTHHFNNDHCSLRKVDLREEGGINILTITIGDRNKNSERHRIHLPVPKGKLREAIEWQDILCQACSD